MPVFLIDHVIPIDATIDQLLESHRNDLKFQEEFNCNYFAYWWDSDFTQILSLVETANISSLNNLYNSLQVKPLPVIKEIDENIMNTFLEKLVDPYHDTKFDELTLGNSSEQTFLLIKSIEDPFDLERNRDHKLQLFQKKIIKELIQKYNGFYIKNNDDYILSSFSSSAKAVHCSINMYKRLIKSNLKYKFTLNTGIPSDNKEDDFVKTIKLNERFCDYFFKDIIISSKVNSNYKNINNELLTEIPYIHIVKSSEEIFLTQFLDHLEGVWSNPELRMEDFLIHLGLSKSQLYRKLNSLTGKSANKFIKDYRLNKALGLILTKKMSITEIAFETGFSSLSYFTKCFQKMNKKSPSDSYSN